MTRSCFNLEAMDSKRRRSRSAVSRPSATPMVAAGCAIDDPILLNLADGGALPRRGRGRQPSRHCLRAAVVRQAAHLPPVRRPRLGEPVGCTGDGEAIACFGIDGTAAARAEEANAAVAGLELSARRRPPEDRSHPGITAGRDRASSAWRSTRAARPSSSGQPWAQASRSASPRLSVSSRPSTSWNAWRRTAAGRRAREVGNWPGPLTGLVAVVAIPDADAAHRTLDLAKLDRPPAGHAHVAAVAMGLRLASTFDLGSSDGSIVVEVRMRFCYDDEADGIASPSSGRFGSRGDGHEVIEHANVPIIVRDDRLVGRGAGQGGELPEAGSVADWEVGIGDAQSPNDEIRQKNERRSSCSPSRSAVYASMLSDLRCLEPCPGYRPATIAVPSMLMAKLTLSTDGIARLCCRESCARRARRLDAGA